MILAPTLTLNALRGPSVDPDVAAYVATSGATDVAAVSAFVKGVKDLGLWEDMVCWPLRSTQNAGTGTTAYSLGGLGTHNGTLVNGPTWGADGITFANASSQYITTTFTTNLSTADTLIGAIAKLTDAGIRYLLALGAAPSTRGLELTQGSATILTCQAFGSTAFAPTINHNTTRGSWESYAALNSNSGTTATVIFGVSSNAATNAAHIVTSATLALIMGQNLPLTASDRFMQGEQAFTYVLRGAAATLANYSALRTLYKSTLGTGLGLP
jgi:hypothetical protein